MNFIGKKILTIGVPEANDAKEKDKQWHAGRTETVYLAPGEELLGCELYGDYRNIFGLRFLIWKSRNFACSELAPKKKQTN